jgi:putative membrane protein
MHDDPARSVYPVGRDGAQSVRGITAPARTAPAQCRVVASAALTGLEADVISYDSKNWIRILGQVPQSRVFRTLFLDVLAAGAYAAAVVWLEVEVIGSLLPLGPSFLSILGIILGLLLVFRTNTAYDRWWEGRRLWGQLVNVSRGLSHHLDAMLGDSPPRDGARAAYAQLLATFAASLSAHLRAPGAVGAHEAPTTLLSSLHRAIHADITQGHLASESRIALAPLLQQFDDVLGACERIRNTPIPYSYSSYVKQFVLVYAIVMPFGLAKDFGYGAIIASMLTFFATMGLELLAEEIEEPFGTDRNDLPLDDIAAVIGRDVYRILRVARPQGAASA